MENKQTIYQLHDEHKTWLNKLLFYKDELSIMTNRISEVAKKNSSQEVLSLVEQFQKQVGIQKEKIDILVHDIKNHESFLEKAAENNPETIEHKKFSDHQKHRASIEVYEKSFNDLRSELIHFLSKWM